MLMTSGNDWNAVATSFRRSGWRLAAITVIAVGMYGDGGESRGQTPSAPRDPRLNVNVMLVKNALAAVNHANLTGNYTVLRDLGSPSFRERNSASQLAGVFERLRTQKTDLSPVLVLDPQFTEPPTINEAGQLQMAGFFASHPLQVQFRMVFQMAGGGWSIDTLAVGTAAPKPAGTAAMPQQGGPNPYSAVGGGVAQTPRGNLR